MVLAAALQPLVGGEQIQRRKRCIILFVYIPCGKRKSCPMLFIYICYGVFPLSIYSLNRLRKGGQRICLMVSVSISVGVAAISVMNICVSVKRKPTPLSTKSTKKNGDFTSVFWHRENRRLGSKKARQIRAFRRRHLFCLHILAELERLELSRRGLADLRP